MQIGTNGYRKAKHDAMLPRCMECALKYKSGYRYKLEEMYLQTLPFDVFDASVRGWVVIVDHRLAVSNGYAWDGASTGLPWTPKKWLRPSLVHDALYQLIREGRLPMERRADADLLFYHMLIGNLTCPFTGHVLSDVFLRMRNLFGKLIATVAYWAVRLFGNYALRKGRKTKEAP